MATLEKIRSHSGILIGAIALALLCFVVGDALNNSSNLFNGSRTQVGKVEGESMSIDEFQKQVTVMSNVYKASGRQVREEDAREAAWNTFVQSSILKKISEETGIGVSKAELSRALFSKDNYHPMLRQNPLLYDNNNQFRPERAIAYVNQLDSLPEDTKSLWLFWENALKEQIMLDKVQYLAINAMSAPKAMVDFLDQMNSKSVKVVCAAKEYRALPDSLFIPSEADKKRKYDERKEFYKTDEVRFMKTIVYNITPTQDDYDQTAEKVKFAEAELKNVTEEELTYFISQESDADKPFIPYYQSENDIDPALKEFAFFAKKDSVMPTFLDGDSYKTAKVLSDVIVRPDSAKISVIVIGSKSIDETRARVDSLMKVLKDGADFSAVAVKHSMHPSVRQNMGDMGWIKEGQFGLDTFDHMVFKMKVNEISNIETPNGTFIVKVTDLTKPVKKVRVASITNKVVPSMTTYHSIYEKANLFIAKNRTSESFEAAAKEANLLVREMGPMSENQNSVYYLEDSRQIVKWAFEAGKGEVTSKPFDCKNLYLIGYLSDVIEKGYYPFSNQNVQQNLEYLVRNDMKAEELMHTMKDVADISSVGVLDTFTVSFTDVAIPHYGNEPAVVAAAYKASANDFVSPIKGENGVFALKVLEVQENAQTPSSAVKLTNSIFSYVRDRMFKSLVDNADKSDNRSRFY